MSRLLRIFKNKDLTLFSHAFTQLISGINLDVLACSLGSMKTNINMKEGLNRHA